MVFNLQGELVKVRGMEMDQNGSEMRNLNESGRLLIGLNVRYPKF